jgi:type I restriction enzyme S subunit
MRQYSSYKDIGIEWIGEIPSHWEVKKLKYGINLINTKGIPQSSDVKISPENVETGTGVCLSMYSDYEGEGLKFIYGDILLNKLRIYLKKILLTTYEGYSMGEMIVLRCKSDSLVNKYLFYSLFHDGLIQLLNSQSNGVKLPRVSPEVIINSEYMFPPLSEQEHIVSYLDDKTTKIDELIQKKLRKIDLLKEYRTSLINTVVTKGLNPNVPMKDSGIEWIGEIPDEWKKGRLGYYSNVYRGSGYQYLNQVDEDYSGRKEKVVRISDITEFNPTWCEYLEQFENYRIKKDEILIGGTGHYFGKSIYVTEEMEGLIHSYNIIRLVVKEQYSKYIQYYISSPMIREQMDMSVLGSGQPFIDLQGLKNLTILIPKFNEQLKIVEYLDSKTKEIDDLVSLEQRKIDTLKEYRQSLISEVVTGKIKVIE